ncbi:hypothetical protein APR04_003810 [Promicromonospora umidemergens]|uniref:Uncharacterized protein n=1 Tax=Promicromonospora umidemergens TaxID=629679 RepID=A0ABP8XID9_9MICO|nr:hypothetical protein [Promicromonospora umidemergens]MCP2284887.1 hypothetical protein [Promicromonospora umidemergens]
MLDTTPEHPYAAGVIRFPATGPEWYANSSHITRGFDTSIPPEIVSSGRLYVRLLTSMPVSFATASPDETFAERGITVGISGAVSGCNIGLSVPGHRDGPVRRRLQLDDPDEYALVASDLANLWLYLARVPTA